MRFTHPHFTTLMRHPMRQSMRHPLRQLWAAATLAFSVAGLAQAQTATEDAATAQYLQQAQQWLNGAMSSLDSAQANGNGAKLKMRVVVGALDSRLRLAPCTQVEPYLPVGTRLWGRSRIGLRCLEGAVRWNVFLPIQVKALGTAWVLNANIAPGSVLSAQDATEAEVDWAEDPSPVVTDNRQWVGQLASRQLTSGQAIRQSSLKAATAFLAGNQVRVVAVGPGFQISSEGQALSNGIVGQTVRLKMENGRVLSGVVVDGQTVRVAL